ncbi:unnamed protein product [Bursaphelenchus okinawaensis]|uniref:ShKT domain-containing protein n=1 Tax=Bursaphelenchus okinawaensis TaxID=465554 RepID=A0A811L1W4_9BILA|nr:unnamed protein product [Bursaphelenchus okinawaensis]CAG9117214.1 unnamed protein product [Bursaphelenchus okinawaensis]
MKWICLLALVFAYVASQCNDKGWECPLRANLCNNQLYIPLMNDQCPKTCNRCPAGGASGSGGSGTAGNGSAAGSGAGAGGGACNDGGPDCAKSQYLCTVPAYATFMAKECAQTCGKCG